jgi:hypothetical protein
VTKALHLGTGECKLMHPMHLREGAGSVRTACCCEASKVGMVARVVYIWDVSLSLAQRGVWSGTQEQRNRRAKNEGSGGDRWRTGVKVRQQLVH